MRYTILVLFLLSCNNDRLSCFLESNNGHFTSDIPRNRDGTPTNTFDFTQVMAKKLGISTIDSGYNSIQIRIWQHYPFNDTCHLFVIQNSTDNKKDWSAKLYTIRYLDDSSEFLSLDVNIATLKTPAIGWRNLVNILLNYKIAEIIDMEFLTGNYYNISHGHVVTIEFATNNTYRQYTYENPSSFRSNWWQARNILSILQLIQDQFKIIFVITPGA